MLIKSLRMENFRQFKGTTMVEFSTDPMRNVTIILGDNTFGKTTLLQAFNWCFYGTVVFPHNPDLTCRQFHRSRSVRCSWEYEQPHHTPGVMYQTWLKPIPEKAGRY